MTGNILYCAFWILYICMPFVSMNAAPVVNDQLLQSKFEDLMEKQRDCQVNKKYEDSNWSGESLSFMIYVEEDEDVGAVACSITYDGRDINLVRDKLILSQKENKMYEFRNGNIVTKYLKTNLDVSGWTQMEIVMIDQQIIMKYMDYVVLNYTVSLPVRGLVIHGSNISICKDETPTWLVQKNITAMIPLVPSRQAVIPSGSRVYPITLHSEDEFTPCFSIDGDTKCLTNDDYKVTWANNFVTLHSTARIMELDLELITGYINIYQEIEGKRKNVISFHKQGRKFIEVSSVNNNFSVSLDIFPQPKAFTSVGVSSVDPNEGTVIYLKIGIAITIVSALATVAIVIIVARRQIQANKKNSSLGMTNKEYTTKESTPLHFDKYDI